MTTPARPGRVRSGMIICARVRPGLKSNRSRRSLYVRRPTLSRPHRSTHRAAGLLRASLTRADHAPLLYRAAAGFDLSSLAAACSSAVSARKRASRKRASRKRVARKQAATKQAATKRAAACVARAVSASARRAARYAAYRFTGSNRNASSRCRHQAYGFER